MFLVDVMGTNSWLEAPWTFFVWWDFVSLIFCVFGAGSFKQGMLGKEERQANYAKKLPYNFSWIEPRRLAGTSIPSTVAQLEGLVREGVKTVLIKLLQDYQ